MVGIDKENYSFCKTHLKNTTLKQYLLQKQAIYWSVQHYQCYKSIKKAYACKRNGVTEF